MGANTTLHSLEQIKELMRQAWYAGFNTSKYKPNPNYDCSRDIEFILEDSRDAGKRT